MHRLLLIAAASASFISCAPATKGPDTGGRAAWSKIDEKAAKSVQHDERDAVVSEEYQPGWQF